MIRIGLPRALLYYHYAPMARAFFEALRIEVVASPPTTRETLLQGGARVVGETCLPVKLYCGHVLALIGEVDHILVPAIHRLRPNTRNCPKLVGLPDLIKTAIPEAPCLAVDIDAEARGRTILNLAMAIGRHFTLNPFLVRRAVRKARRAHEAYQGLLSRGLDLVSAIQEVGSWESVASSTAPPGTRTWEDERLTVAVVGHPYNLYDEYASQRLLYRLQDMDVRVLTPFTVDPEERWRGVGQLVEVLYWTFEDEFVGAAESLMQQGVDGIITISAFGCAPDSVMMSVVGEAARRARIPYMSLILDEHTGEAGLVTRLEAFVDMLARRTKTH